MKARAEQARSALLTRSLFASACLAVAACTSGASKSERAAELVPIADLPARQREVWQRWQRDGVAWELEREAVRADPELVRFVVDNLVVVLVRAYDRSALARVGERAGPFERAQSELVVLADVSTPLLAQLLGVKDGIVAFLAADTLAKIGALANDPTLARLADPSAEVRRRAAELLAKLPHAGADEPRILAAIGERVEKDEAWIVRAQAAEALGTRGSRHVHKGYSVAVLSRALSDADPAVVESAARGIDELGEPRAIPALIRGLERAASQGHVAGVRAAQAALRSLSGERQDKNPAEWSRWWAEKGARLIVPGPRAKDAHEQ